MSTPDSVNSANPPAVGYELRSLRLFARLHAASAPARVTIEDWFDPDDDRHLLAFEQFRETGAWPDGFLPAAVEFPPAWDSHVAFRIAEKWIRHRAAVRLRAEGVE